MCFTFNLIPVSDSVILSVWWKIIISTPINFHSLFFFLFFFEREREGICTHFVCAGDLMSVSADDLMLTSVWRWHDAMHVDDVHRWHYVCVCRLHDVCVCRWNVCLSRWQLTWSFAYVQMKQPWSMVMFVCTDLWHDYLCDRSHGVYRWHCGVCVCRWHVCLSRWHDFCVCRWNGHAHDDVCNMYRWHGDVCVQVTSCVLVTLWCLCVQVTCWEQ